MSSGYEIMNNVLETSKIFSRIDMIFIAWVTMLTLVFPLLSNNWKPFLPFERAIFFELITKLKIHGLRHKTHKIDINTKKCQTTGNRKVTTWKFSRYKQTLWTTWIKFLTPLPFWHFVVKNFPLFLRVAVAVVQVNSLSHFSPISILIISQVF